MEESFLNTPTLLVKEKYNASMPFDNLLCTKFNKQEISLSLAFFGKSAYSANLLVSSR